MDIEKTNIHLENYNN